MKSIFRAMCARWLHAVGYAAFLLILLTLNSGCGVLGAMANPKVAWAMSDPAPMNVVVRRADAAATTAKEVDRLLTSTPANADSDWMAKIGPNKEDATKHMKDVGEIPFYKTSKARVVPSEVWIKTLPTIQNAEGQHPNLLALVDKALADQYAKIMAKKKQVADIKAQISAEELAADSKGVTDAEKAAHKTKIAELEKQRDAADDEISPMQKAFFQSTKDASAKVSADTREKFGVAIVNLRQAVEDAEIANGAAAVRFPMAAPSIANALTSQVSHIVADIVEEQTGKRPNMSTLQPGVTFEGGKVGITLNGLNTDDMGKLSIGELTTEAIKRSTAWVGHALGLLGTISSTSEILSFEEKTLDAMLDGFKGAGWKAPTAAAIPGA